VGVALIFSHPDAAVTLICDQLIEAEPPNASSRDQSRQIAQGREIDRTVVVSVPTLAPDLRHGQYGTGSQRLLDAATKLVTNRGLVIIRIDPGDSEGKNRQIRGRYDIAVTEVESGVG